jgi:hypothetical protein
MLQREHAVSPRKTTFPANRLAQPISKQNLCHAVPAMGPALVMLTLGAVASVAHAQGTMDFSGAQTLMGTFKTTLMKALLDHIPRHERLVVIEQPAELKISHPNGQWISQGHRRSWGPSKPSRSMRALSSVSAGSSLQESGCSAAAFPKQFQASSARCSERGCLDGVRAGLVHSPVSQCEGA